MSRKQKDAAVAQSVVRRIGSAEVTGPIPVSSLKVKRVQIPIDGICTLFLNNQYTTFRMWRV